jgi:chromosome segregation ATPase
MTVAEFAVVEAALGQRDAKIERLDTELKALTEQFEQNWNLIGASDQRIEKLQAELAVVAAQLQASVSQAEMHTMKIETANANLTDLENHDVQICSHIHEMSNQINKIRFETERVMRTAEIPIEIPIEAEVEELKKKEQEVIERRMEAKALTAQVHEAGSAEITNAEQEIEFEKESVCQAISKLTTNRVQLLEVIQNVDAELRECLNRLEGECNALKPETNDCEFAEIHSLEIEMAKLDREIRGLEDQTQEARKQDRIQQDLVYSLEKRVEERKASKGTEISELEAALEREAAENQALKSKLEHFQHRSTKLRTAVDTIEAQSRPDFAEFIQTEQIKLDDEFIAKMELEHNALRTVKEKRKSMIARSQKTLETCESITSDLETLMAATNDARQYCRKAKRKIKAIGLQIAEVEGEIDVLTQPMTCNPDRRTATPPSALTCQECTNEGCVGKLRT